MSDAAKVWEAWRTEGRLLIGLPPDQSVPWDVHGLVLWTSGTDRKAKGVIIPWSAVTARADCAVKAFGMGEDEVILVLLHESVGASIFSPALAAMRKGQPVYSDMDVLPNEPMQETIDRLKPTIVIAYPNDRNRFWEKPQPSHKPRWFIYTGHLLSDYNRRMTEQWLPGTRVCTWYGSREMGGVATAEGFVPIGCVGYPVPGAEVKIEQGLVKVRSASIGTSYIDGSTGLDAEGWFNSGDTGKFDGRGRLIIKPRK